MGLPLQLKKHAEDSERCVYTFGPPGARAGRVVLHKDAGSIEVVDLSPVGEGSNERYYLAQVVPRLQTYHAKGRYPDVDEWEV